MATFPQSKLTGGTINTIESDPFGESGGTAPADPLAPAPTSETTTKFTKDPSDPSTFPPGAEREAARKALRTSQDVATVEADKQARVDNNQAPAQPAPQPTAQPVPGGGQKKANTQPPTGPSGGRNIGIGSENISAGR